MLGDRYLLVILTIANLYAVLAMSWDILAGYAGQVSFGHAAFFGLGAYTSAFLYLHYIANPWLTMLLGGAAAVLLSLVIGGTCMRLRGVYLALLTMAVALVLGDMAVILSPITGGENGLPLTTVFASTMNAYYSSLVFMLESLVTLIGISKSRMGLMFKAIREDEDAAKSLGIDTFRYKLAAFVVSAFFAGVAGAFYGHFIQIVVPSYFSLNVSFYAILMPVMGGIGTIMGAVLGAYILQLLEESVRGSAQYALLLEALIFVLILRFAPSGLLHIVRHGFVRFHSRNRVREV